MSWTYDICSYPVVSEQYTCEVNFWGDPIQWGWIQWSGQHEWGGLWGWLLWAVDISLHMRWTQELDLSVSIYIWGGQYEVDSCGQIWERQHSQVGEGCHKPHRHTLPNSWSYRHTDTQTIRRTDIQMRRQTTHRKYDVNTQPQITNCRDTDMMFLTGPPHNSLPKLEAFKKQIEFPIYWQIPYSTYYSTAVKPLWETLTIFCSKCCIILCPSRTLTPQPSGIKCCIRLFTVSLLWLFHLTLAYLRWIGLLIIYISPSDSKVYDTGVPAYSCLAWHAITPSLFDMPWHSIAKHAQCIISCFKGFQLEACPWQFFLSDSLWHHHLNLKRKYLLEENPLDTPIQCWSL